MYHRPPPPRPPHPQRQNTARARQRSRSPGLATGHLPPDGWAEARPCSWPNDRLRVSFLRVQPCPLPICSHAPHCLLMAGLCLGGSRFSNQTQGSGHSAPGQGCIGRSAHGWDLGSVQGSLWASPALSGPCFWRPLRSQSAQGFTDPCWLHGAPAFHQGRWSGLTTS